jgi:MFS family permease
MPSRNTWLLTLTLCTVQFVDVLGVTVLVVALPSIQRDLGMSDAQRSLVASVYALCFGAFLVLAGRLADVIGTLRLIVAGMSLFLAGAVTGGASHTGWALIAALALQGIGAAAAVPAALAIITGIMPEGPARARALGVWTAAGAVGGAAGFAIGGLVTELLTWRWLFFMTIPILLASLAIVPRLAPPGPTSGHAPPLQRHLASALLLPAGMFALISGLTNMQTHRPADPLVIVPLLAGPALLGAFGGLQAISRDAFIPIAVLTRFNLRLAVLVALTITFVTSAAAILITFWLQDVHAMSAGQTGLLLLPSSVGVIVGAGIGAKILARASAKRGMTVGLLSLSVATVGQLLCLQLEAIGPITLCFALSGMGLGCASVAATDYGLQDADPVDKGVASGILSSAAPIGTALGIALLTTIASVITDARVSGATPTQGEQTVGYQGALVAALGVTLATATVVGRWVPPDRSRYVGAHRPSADRSTLA